MKTAFVSLTSLVFNQFLLMFVKKSHNNNSFFIVEQSELFQRCYSSHDLSSSFVIGSHRQSDAGILHVPDLSFPSENRH